MPTTTFKERLAAIRLRLRVLRQDADAAREQRREDALEWKHAIESSNERFERPNELALHGVAADVAAGPPHERSGPGWSKTSWPA